MSVTIRAHHTSLTDSIKEYVESKLGRLDKYFSNITSISVDLDVSKVSSSEERQSVSATVWVPGNVFRAKKMHSDMYACVDYVFDKLERQLKKYKGKLKERNRHGEKREIIRELDKAYTAELDPNQTPEVANQDAELQESELYVPKPMYVEDAQVIMDERKVPFLMFHNADTQTINVVYRTSNDDISLIEPRASK